MILAAIPSFPRPVLARLTQQMVDRLDVIDGDPDLEPSSYPENYSRDARCAEHRDAAAYLATVDDDEDDDPVEDEGIGNEDDDPAGGNSDDEGEGFTAVECVSQTDWGGASTAHGDGLRHEDEEDDDPAGWRRREMPR